MKSNKNGNTEKITARNRIISAIVILINVILLSFAFVLYGHYTDAYEEKMKEENLGNIANLNKSAALRADAFISGLQTKLDDILRYAELHDLTYDGLLHFIDDTNSDDGRSFELIGGDYTGHVARRGDDGGYIPVSYQEKSYINLQKAFDDTKDSAFDDICFAPEFTDNATALKYFAIYRHLTLKSDDGELATYTLLLGVKSKDILAAFNGQDALTGQSTVLIDSSGDYIVSNSDFKSSNFFQYLYVYNDLTLDEKTEVMRQMTSTDSGELFYKNSGGTVEDCVYRYERMPSNNWYCVTCIPLSSFRTPVFDFNYVVYAVFALLVLLVSDVLWLRYINRCLRSSMQREREASSAKTDFLSRMSHDIRTPINGIIGLTTLALYEDTTPQLREYLENIKVSGEFLTGLVNDILDMSKVESGKVELVPEPYSNRELHKYVSAVITPLCRDKGLQFLISDPVDSVPVMLDRLRFNQILFNLLSNAVKYTPAGGLVELYWERAELPGNRVSLDITVRDNGIGMSEEFQAHMFESFTQEHSQTATTGTGLGLAIVKSLVNLMNGSITVESKRGVGSSFTVHLVTDVYTEAATDTVTAESATLDGKRVLICEDNKINIMVISHLLEKWNMKVDVAKNGRIGVDMFAESKEHYYDIIFMDIIMPEMDGFTASRAIRATERADAGCVTIIAMTSNAYDDDVKKCIYAGMNYHMSKPVDADKLKELLSDIIHKNSTCITA